MTSTHAYSLCHSTYDLPGQGEHHLDLCRHVCTAANREWTALEVANIPDFFHISLIETNRRSMFGHFDIIRTFLFHPFAQVIPNTIPHTEMLSLHQTDSDNPLAGLTKQWSGMRGKHIHGTHQIGERPHIVSIVYVNTADTEFFWSPTYLSSSVLPSANTWSLLKKFYRREKCFVILNFPLSEFYSVFGPSYETKKTKKNKKYSYTDISTEWFFECSVYCKGIAKNIYITKNI